MSKTLPLKPLRPHTFLTLDALRGLAALSVVIYHLDWIIGHVYFEHAYLAVDFFFMLSSFVLTYAYQQRLDSGLSSFAFMKARLIRLYPLYLAGTLVGFVYAIVTFVHAHRPGVAGNLLNLLLSLLFIPSPPTADFPGIAAFPYNTYAWSLFYELIANLAHALLLRRRSTHALAASAALLGIAMCGTVLHLGNNTFGTLTRDLPIGIIRVLFSYIFGMLLYRLWNRNRDRMAVSPIWAVLLLIVTVSISVAPQYNGVFDTLALLFVLPAVVLLGAFSQPAGFAVPIATLLGVLSYATYILSAPIGIYTSRACEYLFKRPSPSLAPWPGIAAVVLTCLIAWIADTFYDIPVRRWLRRRLKV